MLNVVCTPFYCGCTVRELFLQQSKCQQEVIIIFVRKILITDHIVFLDRDL